LKLLRSIAVGLLSLGMLLAVFAGAIYALALIVEYLLGSLSAFEEELSAALVATGGTVLAAVATVVYNQRRTHAREIAEAHRPEKVRVYNLFMATMVDQLRKTKTAGGSPLNAVALPPELIDTMFSFKRDLIVWGSPGVIRSYHGFEQKVARSSPKQAMLLFDDMLRQIRKDLGSSNWLLQRGDLIQLFLTDNLRELPG